MIEIPGRLGNIYRRFEPGEIIAPPDSPEKRAAFYGREDLVKKYETWDEYILQHTWVVVRMLEQDVGVVIKRIGELEPSTPDNSVDTSAYVLATREQIAAAIVRRIRGKRQRMTVTINGKVVQYIDDVEFKIEGPISPIRQIGKNAFS